MEWEFRQPEPNPISSILEFGPIRLSIAPAEKDPRRLWQHLMLTVGQHTTAEPLECMREWPREAISRARRALDEFEAKLNEGESNGMPRS